MSGKHANRANGEIQGATERMIEKPSALDGSAIWKIARDSGKLDLNSSYAYILWCHDFAETSAVARVDGEVVGFVIGYVKPSSADTVVVWQVAVRASERGKGTAGALLDTLLARLADQGVRYLETTITPNNHASIALFRSLADRWGAALAHEELFDSALFPDEHESEALYRIGPFAPNANYAVSAV